MSTRLRNVVALALAFSSFRAFAADAARDPVEGLWLGTAGTDRERIEVGLDFHRDADGRLRLWLTQPIMNYFGVADPGEVKREGDRVVDEALFLDLTLSGDTLTGHYPGPKSAATFRRVDTLPTEIKPPELPTPGPLWQTRLNGQIYASPVVADGVAYVGPTGGTFNAVDAKTGRIAWAFGAGGPIFGAATVAGDAVYFACDAGFLFKLDRASGEEIWRYDLADRATPRVLPHPTVFAWDWQGAQPLVADGVVYVGAGDGGFHAVDAATGQRRWRFVAAGKIRSGAAVSGDGVFFGSADHFVYALDRRNGAVRWRYDTKGDVDSTPVLHDGKLLIGNRGYGLFALAADSGEELWKNFFWGSWVESTPVVVDGTIYIGASDLRRVSAIDPASGRVIWRSDVYGWTWGTPVVTKEKIYAGAAGGTPYALHHVASFSTLDRRSGKLIARWPIADTGGHQWGIAGSPALAGDSIVFATIAGSLYAFPL
jgi:outer membrane protein assembly factor BamB